MSEPHTKSTLVTASTGNDLDRELARRLTELRDRVARDADCAAGSRPILIRALCWTIAGLGLWLLGVVALT